MMDIIANTIDLLGIVDVMDVDNIMDILDTYMNMDIVDVMIVIDIIVIIIDTIDIRNLTAIHIAGITLRLFQQVRSCWIPIEGPMHPFYPGPE